jgi:uncharacterized protein (TIGR02594 family)
MDNKAIYDVASEYIGLAEVPGAKHNAKIVKMYADTGNGWVTDDETPWCAAFVGSVLARCGIQGTGKLNARSYLTWGQKIDIMDAKRGDVVILSRGNSKTQGHVAFFDNLSIDSVYLLGGNQGDKVSVVAYPRSRVLGVRRAPARPAKARTNATQSTTVRASALQIASGAGAGITAVSALDGTAQIVALAFAGVVILAAAWVMRERLRRWAAGDK